MAVTLVRSAATTTSLSGRRTNSASRRAGRRVGTGMPGEEGRADAAAAGEAADLGWGMMMMGLLSCLFSSGDDDDEEKEEEEGEEEEGGGSDEVPRTRGSSTSSTSSSLSS